MLNRQFALLALAYGRGFIRLIFAYTGIVPNVRTCVVSFSDPDGMTHSVEVAAASVYEAAALKTFRTANLMPDAVPALATRITVRVKSPTTAHELTVGKLDAWLKSNGKSPREHALKSKLRKLLTERQSDDRADNTQS